MPDVAKLKKKAADFELKKQFDKALAVYVEILDGFNSSDDDVDVSLFNRVGDLFLKQGSVGDAVDYYEQAVDRYADGGFFNNAIALCNKILRNSPGRASVYYKLGKISAQKGFKSDAKKNFLEYADRMQSSGKFDEAFRALKEFADLCPDQDDIRLMLADQLSRKGRSDEAVEQLQLLYERYAHDGRDAEAAATIQRMKAIDPSAEPRALGDAPRRSAADLVFLDLNDSPPAPRISHSGKRATLGLHFIADDEPPAPSRADAETPRIATPVVPAAAAPAVDGSVMLDGVTGASDFGFVDTAPTGGSILDGLEPTSFSSTTPVESSTELLDFEPTSFEIPPPPPAAEIALPELDVSAPDLLEFDLPPTPAVSLPAIPSAPALTDLDFGATHHAAPVEPPRNVRPSLLGLPMLVDENGAEPAEGSTFDADDNATIGGDLELIMPEGTPVRGTPLQPAPSDQFPAMDLEMPSSTPVADRAGALARNSVEMPPLEMEALAAAPGATPVDNAFDLAATATPRSTRRQSTLLAEQSVELLQALSDADPDDNLLRRRLAETMLESGDRDGGLRELEAAMVGFERGNDLVAAAKIADEIVLLNPESVRHHQKRVEYAFRTNERGRLIEAYLQLADALFRAGQVEKSRAIYQRVIDLSPDDVRATSALQNLPVAEPAPEPAPLQPKHRPTAPISRLSTPVMTPKAPAAPPTSDDTYINLGDWLRDDEAPKDTRMIVEEEEPTGDEAADFQDMLKKFKQGISENVEEEDHQSHYDLGVAYKEMGLLDEAIAEFQKALRAPANRVPTYEALGLCFIEKEQYPMAATILSRALHEQGVSEDKLVGVLYLLGRCAEERGQRDAAIDYYQRVFVVDIQFRDVAARLAAIEGAAS